MVKNLPVSTGDVRDMGLIPVTRRSPGGGHGNSLQYSCLENPIGRGAWQAEVHKVAQSLIQLKQLCMHACTWVLNSSDVCFSEFSLSPLILNDSLSG